MKTIEEVLDILEARLDRQTLEDYIDRQWLRPVSQNEKWYFEEIDIARLQLVCHLTQDMEINDQGMDVVLSLLDQLYGIRAQAQQLHQAIAQQSPEVQAEIRMAMSMNDSDE